MACYDEKKTAQIGYKAYSISVGGKSFTGDDMPTWKALPDKQKKAWIAATSAIFKEVNDFFIESHTE